MRLQQFNLKQFKTINIMLNVKETLGNVDMKSAGIGAAAIVVVEAAGFGIYKGIKYLSKVGKQFMEARKLERAQQASEEEKKEESK